MRHFCHSGTVATLAGRMGMTTGQPLLVASTGGLQRGTSDGLCTVPSTVALTAVTVAAEQELGTTTGAERKTGERK